jgi:hypothetical protein
MNHNWQEISDILIEFWISLFTLDSSFNLSFIKEQSVAGSEVRGYGDHIIVRQRTSKSLKGGNY